MKVEPTDNVAVSILYRVADLDKLMPSFVNQLNVPLVAISDATKTDEMIFLQDKSDGCHFKNYWKFTEDGYRNTTTPVEVDDSLICLDPPGGYDYREGLRGDPDEANKR